MTFRSVLVGGAMFASLLCFAAFSRAKDKTAADYQKEFEGWTKRLVALEKADTTGASKQDIEMIRTLVGQGQAFVASDKLDAVEPLMARADALGGLIEARSARIEQEAKTKKAEALASDAEAKAAEAKAKADAAEKRRQELEAMGL